MKRIEQLAPSLNAYRVAFEGDLLNEIRQLFISALSNGLSTPQSAFLFNGDAHLNFEINSQDYRFNLKSYGKTPLLWVSCNDMNTYQIFRRFADSLQIQDDIKKLVDFDKDLVMYCGFFVIGNRLYEENWHVDYLDGANAYTFITPLFEPDHSHGNLIYKDAKGRNQKYHYKLNEGVIFGDKFQHSTECYKESQNLRVLVSFTIGTDKPEYWPTLRTTIGTQSKFMLLPCGHERGTCQCLD